MFDAIERAYRDSGREVWPTPQVRDFGVWLREQYLTVQLDDPRSLRALSEMEERELWCAVIDASEAGREMIEPGAAARAARRARRALHEYGIPLRAVAAHASAESQAFIAWNAAFDEQCRAHGCIGGDGLLALIGGPRAPIAWIESHGWRPTARRWLEQHGQRLAAPLTSDVQSPAVQWRAASPAAELSAIGEWARANLQENAGFRAWVCVPDLNRRRADVIDAMDAALAPRRFALQQSDVPAPYAVAGGAALAEHSPVRIALDTLTATLGRIEFVRFSALLRAPEFSDSAADAGAAALVDIELRDRAPSEADLAAWLALADNLASSARLSSVAPVTALERLRAVRQALEKLRGAHPLSAWGSVWIEALQAGPWAGRGKWSSAQFQAAERFRELLGSLATGDSIFGMQSRPAAQRILLRAAQDTPFQAQTGVPAIWISGQIMDPWLNYAGLWVSGCSDEQWPPPVEAIALLPVSLQRDYGVVSAAAESQLRQAMDLQRCWQSRAQQTVFSYADPGDGRSSAPSPLLAGLRTREAGAEALPQPHWRAVAKAAPLERLVDELAPAFAHGERTRGVSTLKAQSRCAFRGFAETRLATFRLGQPVPGFNDRERGELVHHALEHVWSVLRGSAALSGLTPDSQSQLLDAAASHALTRMSRVRDPGTRWRQREHERLQQVLAKWLDVERLRSPFEVQNLELGGNAVRFGGLEFSVRIDRVDRLPDGGCVLIDYKTGATHTDWQGDRPDNPQLPIYALLHPQALVGVAYGRVNAADPGFKGEHQRADIFKPRRTGTSLEGLPDFPALIEVWRRRVERLAQEFAAGRAEVAPTATACRSCRLQGLCRVPAGLEETELEPVDE